MDALRWILLVIAVVIIVAIYFFSRGRNKEQSDSPLNAANDVPSFSADDRSDTKASDDWVHGVGPVRVLEQEEAGLNETKNVRDNLKNSTAPDWDSLYAQSAEEKNQIEKKPVNHSPDKSQSELESESEDTAKPESDTPVENLQNQKTAQVNDQQVKESSDKDDAIDDVISVYVLASDEEPLIQGDKILSASYALHLEHGEMRIFHRHSDSAEHEILFSMANIQNPGWFDVERMNDLSTRGMSFFMQVNLVDNPSHVLDDMLICAHQMATMLGGVLCNPQREPLDETHTNILREKVKHLEQIKAQSV